MKPHPDDKWNAIRATLLARAAELRDRLQRVRSDLGRQREPLPRDFDDAAIVKENDEVLEAIEGAATRELGLIEAALGRIEQGVFGLCVNCAGEIDARRLQVVPYASHCRQCSPGD
ncbi:MAG TPA: hypothetical protein VFV88_11310 [Steroidobacteraceae bacterium]|jgi:RNA polymerase-binding transcription factor DksA|nr:hypothetical protein [Steroidobacteraceae bacterium]